MRRLALAAAVVAATASAVSRPARDAADLEPQGFWSVGVFNPLRYALLDGVELQVHPLVFFVAPHLDARFALVRSPVRLTLEAGLSVPTFGMRLLKGYFFPSWGTSANDVGWMVIPRLGLLVSGTVFEHDVWTVKADGALRVGLGANGAAQLNSFLAPLDLLLAAPLTGFVARVGGAYDKALSETFRLRGEVNVYVTGAQGRLMVEGQDVGPLAPLSPVLLTAHLGVDIAVFRSSRVTVGVLWANYDQGATAVVAGNDGYSERVRVRSNNFLPTLDFIWAGP